MIVVGLGRYVQVRDSPFWSASLPMHWLKTKKENLEFTGDYMCRYGEFEPLSATAVVPPNPKVKGHESTKNNKVAPLAPAGKASM